MNFNRNYVEWSNYTQGGLNYMKKSLIVVGKQNETKFVALQHTLCLIYSLIVHKQFLSGLFPSICFKI